MITSITVRAKQWGKKMPKTDRLHIIFARNSEPIPTEFSLEITATSDRLKQKQASRQTANFLLHHLFEIYQLDKKNLNNIRRTESGRPYISHSEIDFNISHSGEWVAIIFSQSKNKRAVGIDIEQPQKIRRYNDLLNYYANAQEITEIQQGECLPQLQGIESRFYLSWCLREAVLKAQGVGIIKLSEVSHSLCEHRITSAHCPQGKLFFYPDLPFYLACFVEQNGSMLLSPEISEWKCGKLHSITSSNPIIYQVN